MKTALAIPRLLVLACALWLGLFPVAAETPRETHARLYAEAKKAWQAAPTNSAVVLRFGKAAFEHADFAENNSSRSAIAEEAIGTLRTLLGREPNSGPAHYWLAMNLGQLARTKTLGALKIVREIEREFLAARELDKQQDFAGPDRNLGQLYFQAPGWPTSVGNDKKARVHLDEALKLAPDFPANQVGLLEVAVDSRDIKTAQSLLKTLADGRAKALEKFSGPEWQDDWEAWDKDRDQCSSRLAELVKSPSNRGKR